MITPVEMYEATCDHCGTDWEDGEYGYSALWSASEMKQTLKDSGWHIGDGDEGEDGKTYCPNCYHWDDDDKFTAGPMPAADSAP